MKLKKTVHIFGACLGLLAGTNAQATDLPSFARGGPRVVIVENPRATVAFQAQAPVVRQMMDRGILQLSGKTNLADAWRAFVSPQDVIGLKVLSAPGPNSGTRPAVAAAVIEGLLAAGIPPKNIVLWDRQLTDLRLAGYEELAQHYQIRLAATATVGWDEAVYYDNAVLGNLVWGDLEFGRGENKTSRRSHVSKLLTHDLTKIINLSPLLNHNLVGVNGNLYNLAMGSVDNTIRFDTQPERLATAVPEIYAMTNLSDHVVLNITDALIGQYQGEQLSLLHYATELNQLWLSKDPVALDLLGIQELDRERQYAKMVPIKSNPELYHNASLLELGANDVKKIRVEMVK